VSRSVHERFMKCAPCESLSFLHFPRVRCWDNFFLPRTRPPPRLRPSARTRAPPRSLRDAALATTTPPSACVFDREHGPRPTGSVQADRAARYVAEAMRAAVWRQTQRKLAFPHGYEERRQRNWWSARPYGGHDTEDCGDGLALGEHLTLRTDSRGCGRGERFDELQALATTRLLARSYCSDEKF